MFKTYDNQDGFSAIEGLLVIIAVTLIVGVGFYVVNSQKADKTSSLNRSTTSTQLQPTTTATKSEPVATASNKTDTELITQAVKSYKGPDGKHDQSQVTVTVDSIVGDNAKGSFFEQGVGGASFSAHKVNNIWQIVSESQQ
jgi:hypothetical protein